MARPVTLITGASSGLGAAFARACARRGEELVLVARRRERLEALAREVGKAHVLPADLSDPQAPAALLREVDALGLDVTVLINNAGFGLMGPVAGQPAARLAEMIAVNVAAVTALARGVLPAMLDRGRGAILNVASTAAFQAGPGMAVYFATKAYVLSFSEALHHELKGKGIAVSALCPGKTATEFAAVAGGGKERFGAIAADADRVVAAGLKGLDRNQAIVVPGLINKLTAQSNRIMPRAAMRRIVAGLKL